MRSYVVEYSRTEFPYKTNAIIDADDDVDAVLLAKNVLRREGIEYGALYERKEEKPRLEWRQVGPVIR